MNKLMETESNQIETIISLCFTFFFNEFTVIET